jgi:hypothetical protein
MSENIDTTGGDPLASLETFLASSGLRSPNTDRLASLEAAKNFSSVDLAEIDSFLQIINKYVNSGSPELREISILLRNQSSRMNFLEVEQMDLWASICLRLINICSTDHLFTLEHDQDWYFDAINSVCGNALHAGLAVLLLNKEQDSDNYLEGFLSNIEPHLLPHIEESVSVGFNSHAEPLIAALSRNAIWIDRHAHAWFESNILRHLDAPEIQTARAFWQGFLVNRAWDLDFIKSSHLDQRILFLLDWLTQHNTSYEGYFDNPLNEPFVWLLADFFLRSPSYDSLESFFSEFLKLEIHRRLGSEWLRSVAYMLQDIDIATHPDLGDDFFKTRLLPLWNSIFENWKLDLDPTGRPEVISSLAESVVALNHSFPQAVDALSEKSQNFGVRFEGSSRLLIWLNDKNDTGRLFEQYPEHLCRLLSLIVRGSSSDRDFSDWQVSDILEGSGSFLKANSPQEFQELYDECRQSQFVRTLEVNSHLFEKPSDVT